MRGGAFLKGKEGRVGFRKNTFFNGKEIWVRFRKNPSLMGKRDASECNESSLSNCRVQLALSTKKYGYVFEKNLFSKESLRISKTKFFSL